MQDTVDTYLLLESADTGLQTQQGLMHPEGAGIKDSQQFLHQQIPQLE